VKELVVISGKGGTGKTSVVASFAALAGQAVTADCDVDAADLHLVLEPTVLRQETFSGGSKAYIRPQDCTGCGRCREICRFEAIGQESDRSERSARVFRVDPVSCEGCGLCQRVCPENAIDFGPAVSGEWYISQTRCGPMVHAKLGVAAENSGKLVSLVRRHARRIAQERQLGLVLVDGSPGIGCPVIASLTGASLVLIVTEPTLSGLHDLRRVAELTRHFGIPGLVCVNKWDLNGDMAGQIERWADEHGLPAAGRLRYDPQVTRAQIHGQSVVEYAADGVAADIRQLWRSVSAALAEPAVRAQG
jgi:MinD superfamily P-loop ATPase